MVKSNQQRYNDAAHAMQTGVALEMARGDDAAGDQDAQRAHKHLRVGINSCMVTDAALANLLMRKRIITLEEYQEEVADQMEAEVQRYQERHPGVHLL